MKNKEKVSFTKMIEYINKAIKYVNGYNFVKMKRQLMQQYLQ